MKEEILVLPDFMMAQEKLQLLGSEKTFHKHLSNYGYGWPHINALLRTVERTEAERVPNPKGERIRQAVAQVMVFELPEELYKRIRYGMGMFEGTEELTDQAIKNIKFELFNHAYLLASKRLVGSGDARLHHTISTAFGGHVDKEDGLHHFKEPFLDGVVRAASERELLEEVEASDEQEMRDVMSNGIIPLAIINSGASEVSSIHTGFVQVLAVPDNLGLKVRETDKLVLERIPFGHFRTHYATEMEEEYDLEDWSRFSLIAEPDVLDAYTNALVRSIRGQKED